MKYVTVKLVLVLAFCASALAQRPARFVSTAGSDWQPEGLTEWSLDIDGSIYYLRSDTQDFGSSTSSIAAPGGICVLSESEALVCGRNDFGDGVIERWSFNSGLLTLVDSRIDSGRDVVGVAFDPTNSSLFALDAVGSVIHKSSWSVTVPLSSLSWAVWATAAQVPQLALAETHTLVSYDSESVSLVEYPRGSSVHGVNVSLVGTSITSSTIANPYPGYEVYAVPVASSEEGTSVTVKALVGVPFQVVRLSNNSVIGSGVGLGVDAPVVVTTSEPLVLGERYVARVTGQPTPSHSSFECVRRYGVSESLSDGTAMQPFFYQMGAVSGQVVSIQLALKRDHALPLDKAYDGYLLIAIRFPTDPIVVYGANYLLDPLLMVPVQGWIGADQTTGVVTFDLPVPADVGGLVFLVQYTLLDGSDFKLSQVYGSIIKPQ